MLHCVSLRCTACFFDTFIYCNVIAIVAILTTLHNYSTILFSIFCALDLIYYLFQVCTLKRHHS